MKESVMTMVRALCSDRVEDMVLEVLCDAACRRLDEMLADGVTANDCAEAYLPAAAWLTLAMLKDSRNWEGVTSLSAGDMTVRREGGSALEGRAMTLMGPWLKDRSFVFQGVRG